MDSNNFFAKDNPKELVDPTCESKDIFTKCFSLIGKTSFSKRYDKKKYISKPEDTSHDSDNDVKVNRVNVCVYSINISKVLHLNESTRKKIKTSFKLKRFRDLIHSVCALYDNSLPDIGPSSVYDCLCAPKSYTILITKNLATNNGNDDDEEEGNESDKESVYNDEDCLSKLEEENPEPEGLFKDIYSDNEDLEIDTENECEDGEDEDFTLGLKTFLDENNTKKGENANSPQTPFLKSLIACATLQRCIAFPLPGQEEWVIDLQLMSVRQKYRGFNIGKYLVSLVQNKTFVKNYDAIVTSSDLDAIQFYEKYGFSKDPILNSKYWGIGDIWTNTTKMCYIPPYASLATDGADDENSFISELAHMEKDFKRWQKVSFGAYQSQAAIFNKLKQEIFTLKAKLCAKDGIIEDLKIKNDILLRKNKAFALKIENLEIDKTE